MMRVAIVGGGISGLAAAYYLEHSFLNNGDAGAVLDIELFEASERLGGKIKTFNRNGLVLEQGAESFLTRKPAGVDFCERLGISDQLVGTVPENKGTFVWRDEQMHPLPEGMSGFVPTKLVNLFRSSLLSPASKLRMALEYLLPAKRSAVADETLGAFFRRRIGAGAYENLVEPLLCGIYSGKGDQLSIQSTYPELRQLEIDHGSVLRGLKKRSAVATGGAPPFATFRPGMSYLVDTAEASLKHTVIHLDTAITSVELGEASVNLKTYSKDLNARVSKTFDAVIVAVPSFIAAQLFETHHRELTASLRKIVHASTATVNIWFDASVRDSMSGYGFVIPQAEQNIDPVSCAAVTAVTWTSSKHFNRTPTDNVALLRTYLGRTGAEVSANTTDQELLSTSLEALQRTMGLTAKPLGSLVTRWVHGSPQYLVGHSELLNSLDDSLTSHRNLALCGASYRGVGIPDCIHQGKQAASAIEQFLNRI